MQKIKVLSKEQYCYLNNIDQPELYKDAKEISKWLNLKDEFQKHYNQLKKSKWTILKK